MFSIICSESLTNPSRSMTLDTLKTKWNKELFKKNK